MTEPSSDLNDSRPWLGLVSDDLRFTSTKLREMGGWDAACYLSRRSPESVRGRI